MRLVTIGRSVAVLAALSLLVLAVIAALPWVASTQIVRERIAYELSVWSGYRVSLGEAPSLDIWPTFSATLNDVAFHEWARDDTPPVLEADSMNVTMSALAALGGDVVLSRVTIDRPVLRLTTRGSVVDLPASPGGGRMIRAVDLARGVVETNPGNPDTRELPSEAFGTVEFTDGRVIAAAENNAVLLSSLNGKIVWPSLNRAATITATGIWRGENIKVEISSGQPLLLLAGGNAPLQASLNSPLLAGTFSGVANFAGQAFFDGKASVSTPSLKRALEWSETSLGSRRSIGEASISAHVEGTARRLKLNGAELALGSDVGRGVIDLAFTGSLPSITGTLAFDQLNIGSFLSVLTPTSGRAELFEGAIGTDFADKVALDLRVSADSATLGPVTFTKVAASTQVKAGLAAFDISDAAAFGGLIQAGVRVDRMNSGQAVEIRLMGSDVDARTLATSLGNPSIVPEGKATLSLTLKGTGTDWATVLSSAEGSLSATIGQGALSGVDLAAFKQKWTGGGFFALSEAAKGSLPFRAIDLKASIAHGIARIEKANILLAEEVVSVRGIVPFLGRALALSGHFAKVSSDAQRGSPTSAFFIGGAWDAPYVSGAGTSMPFE